MQQSSCCQEKERQIGIDVATWLSCPLLTFNRGNFDWFLALFFGFWVMYSTAISKVDPVVRHSTDMLWFAQPGIRNRKGQ